MAAAILGVLDALPSQTSGAELTRAEELLLGLAATLDPEELAPVRAGPAGGAHGGPGP